MSNPQRVRFVDQPLGNAAYCPDVFDRPMSLPDAANYLGRITGQKPHTSTLWRWCLKGCKGVRLESICIGGKRFVTAAAIDDFIDASTRRRPDG